MPDVTSGESPPRRPPLGLSPAVPRFLLLLSLWGIALGLWPMAYWANRNADGIQATSREAIEICEVDLALRAVAVRRFRERNGRLPASLSEAEADGPTLAEWLDWAGERRFDGSDRLDDIYHGVEEPWTRYGRYMWVEYGEESLPAPGPSLDLFGLPARYDPGAAAGAVRSDDDLPAVVVAYLEENGGVPPESAEPFSLDGLGHAYYAERSRDASVRRVVGWGLLLGGIALVALAWWGGGRAWRGHPAGRVGGAITTVFAFITGLAVFVGLFGWHATCYLRGRFSTRYLSKEKRLEILDAAVTDGTVREDVAERARAYLLELPG